MKQIKKKTLKKNRKSIDSRVNKIEIEFAKYNAISNERYKSQYETLKRIEEVIKSNTNSINKLFAISNTGLGAFKVLVLIGTIIASVVGFFKFKDIF